ncbi:hypothetical protein TWF281_000857 [Arthrobotrys megalospora]
MTSSLTCLMITIINLATLLWVLWVLGSFASMVEASVITSAASGLDGNEATAHSIEDLLSHKFNKGYENSLALINSLHIPHSCLYSSLTEAIITHCSSSPTVLDGEEKNFFATKLAICELSSANIDYPRECRGNIQSSKDLNRCIKRLESRPQWWTSWSNCIQSVGVLCQAVREEAERENLLKLHRNITILHHSLKDQLSISINLYSSNLKMTAATSAMVHGRLAALIGEIDTLLNFTVIPMDGFLANIKNVMASIDRAQVTHAANIARQNAILERQALDQQRNMVEVEIVVKNVAKALEALEGKLSTMTKDEASLRETLGQMSVALKGSSTDAIEAIKDTMKALHATGSETGMQLAALVDSIVQGQTAVDTLAEGFESLSNSHERIARSIQMQEESANRQFESVAYHATLFNNTFINAIAESAGLLDKLSAFQQHPQTAMAQVPGLAFVSTYLPVLISILVVIDRKRSAIAIIFFATLYIFFMSYPSAAGSDDSDDEKMVTQGLLIDAGVNQYRWLQDCATMITGYVRNFW